MAAKQRFIEYWLTPQSGIEQFGRPSMQHLMLTDFYRTVSFRNAIDVAPLRGKTVLEIGAGTGILSIFAQAAGAKHVYAIEGSDLADVAREVVRENHLGSMITIIKGYSLEVELPERADLLISETLGHLAFDEGILETCHDAQRRLLKPGAAILPGSFTIMAAPVHAPEFATVSNYWESHPYGITMTPVAQLAKRMSYLSRFDDDAFIAAPTMVFERTMGEPPNYPLKGSSHISIQRDALAHGMALSFTSALGPYITLDSRAAPSWQELFLPFNQPISLRTGNIVAFDFEVVKTAQQTYAYSWSGGVVGSPDRAFSGAIP